MIKISNSSSRREQNQFEPEYTSCRSVFIEYSLIFIGMAAVLLIIHFHMALCTAKPVKICGFAGPWDSAVPPEIQRCGTEVPSEYKYNFKLNLDCGRRTVQLQAAASESDRLHITVLLSVRIWSSAGLSEKVKNVLLIPLSEHKLRNGRRSQPKKKEKKNNSSPQWRLITWHRGTLQYQYRCS